MYWCCLALQHILYKVIGHEEKDETKFGVEMLFNYIGATTDEHTTSFLQIIRTIGGMPYLSAFNHINEIIAMAPEIFKFITERAGKISYQLFPAAKFPYIRFFG